MTNWLGAHSNPALRARLERAAPLLQPERVFGNDGKNFIWIRRNPLKSPDSAKEKQGNPSLFAWFYLVLLAFPWRKFSRQVVSAGLAAIRS
jgi:hypothetical protein